MKRFISALLVAFLIILSMPALAYETSEEPKNFSVVMAINEEIVLVNGISTRITAPVMVFDKTYVDLFALAPLIGIDVKWIDDYIGYSKVSTDNGEFDFTFISVWEDLTTQKYKFFVKESVIFVSLRELCDIGGINIIYENGIITLGSYCDFDREIYGDVDIKNINDYVYTTYPLTAWYVVNPYQKYSYETMLSDAKNLEHMYPDLIKTSSIGKSVEGRELLLMEFGRGANKIFVCGTHHGREYISSSYLMYAVDRYANSYRKGGMWGNYNLKEILDNITFCIIPMVNPDGVNLVQNGLYATKNPAEIASMGIYEGKKYGYSAWKANVHGVDLNWNYDKDWTLKKNKNKRGSVGFNGDYPCSEPETMAVSKYVDSNLFYAFLSFHTQGEIFYWGKNPEISTNINTIMKKDTGFKEYTDDGNGVGGSFFDYVYRKYKKPTMTVELCPYIGNFPYPDKDFDTVWKPTKNVLLIVGSEIISNIQI